MNLPNKLTVVRVALVPVFIVLYYLGYNADPIILSSVYPIENDLIYQGFLSIGFYIAAFVCFAVASLTDMLDGRIARKHGLETNFGKLMDPLADKILIVSAFIILMDTRFLPVWAVIIIISREFAITGLRGIAAAEGEVIAASIAGKLKTILQMAAILLALIYFIFRIAYFLHMMLVYGETVLENADYEHNPTFILAELDYTFSDIGAFWGDVLSPCNPIQIVLIIVAYIANICLWAAVAVTVISGVEYLDKGSKFLNTK